MNTTQTSKRLSFSLRVIQRWCNDGRLRGARRVGREWRIPETEVKRHESGAAAAFPDKEETLQREETLHVVPREEQPAKQHALTKHFDDLVKVAESLRFNLKVPSPKRAQEDEFPIDDRKYEGLSGTDRLLTEVHDLYAAALPGPKWYGYLDGSIEIGFYAEEFRLFPGLMEHLKGTDLDGQLGELKVLLKRYIELCRSLEGKVEQEELPNVPEVASLYAKSDELVAKLADGLDVFINRRWFPGQCHLCP